MIRQFFTLYPCFWLTGAREEASTFYLKLFPNSIVLSKSAFATKISLGNYHILLLDNAEDFNPNPSISLFTYCGSKDETTRLYKILTEKGRILMPLQSYPWSPLYAWVIDQFGISWQLDSENIKTDQKIVPCLLFTNTLRHSVRSAITKYCSIWKPSSILMESTHSEGTADVLPDDLLFAQIKLNGTIINAMSSAIPHDFGFTPGASLVVECSDQEEIDRLWEILGENGSYSNCGWLRDEYGISWQIIPKDLDKLISEPETSAYAIQALLQMKKIELSKLTNN